MGTNRGIEKGRLMKLKTKCKIKQAYKELPDKLFVGQADFLICSQELKKWLEKWHSKIGANKRNLK